MGHALSQALLTAKYPVVIVSRRPPPSQLLAGIRWEQLDVHSPDQLEGLFSKLGPLSAVVNLVGILHGRRGSPYGPDFRTAHVELPQHLVSLLEKHGPQRFIQVSALGASSTGPSMYLRSKGDAENQIKQSRLQWTLLRPSVIFGKRDNFINMFSALTRFLRIFPLAGADALMQPVCVEDVAQTIVRCLSLPQTIHQSYDLAGPKAYSLAQLVEFSAHRMGRNVWVLKLPLWMGKLQAGLMESLPGTPLMSRDNLDSLGLDSVLPPRASNPLASVFDITPTPLESMLP